jgi:CHASE3 domain sensor protein
MEEVIQKQKGKKQLDNFRNILSEIYDFLDGTEQSKRKIQKKRKNIEIINKIILYIFIIATLFLIILMVSEITISL